MDASTLEVHLPNMNARWFTLQKWLWAWLRLTKIINQQHMFFFIHACLVQIFVVGADGEVGFLNRKQLTV